MNTTIHRWLRQIAQMDETDRAHATALLKLVAEDLSEGDSHWRVTETIQWYLNQQVGEAIPISPQLARFVRDVATQYIPLHGVRTIALDAIAHRTPSRHEEQPDATHWYHQDLWFDIWACLDAEPDPEDRVAALEHLLQTQDDPSLWVELANRLDRERG
jgi:hypothetical protein